MIIQRQFKLVNEMLPEIRGEEGEITKEFQEYINEIGAASKPKRHKFYDKSVEHMKEMGIHMTGDNPKKLLDKNRPNEDKIAKKYRLDSYEPETKASANKVTSVINRIYNERLFSINYPKSPVSSIENDDLEDYLTKDMPLYVSLINYIKSVFTKMHLKDANAVLGVLPDFEIEDTEKFEPLPIFYTAEEVVDFKDNEFYVILIGTEKKDQSQTVTIYDKQWITTFFREKHGDDFELNFEWQHGFDHVPAFRIGGVVIKTEPPQLFESFIAGVLPHWNKAANMFSDAGVCIINNAYPDKWEYTVDCTAKGCTGGQVTVTNADSSHSDINCTVCQGTGNISFKGPFSIYRVNRDALNVDAPLPIPPFGYGEKELGSTELLLKEGDKQIEKGYSAVNMDILNKVGENQSGVSKIIDRQDLDGFLDVYSSHIFKYVFPNLIWNIMLWRYFVSFKENEESLMEYFPLIKEPTTFDVYSITLLTEEFAKLKEAGVGGAFLSGMQKDIIDKRFPDEMTKKFLNTIIDIDPLGQLSNEEMLTNSRVIGRIEMYIHTYSKDLVEESIESNKDFLTLTLAEQKVLIRALAESKLQPEIIVEDGQN